MKVVYFGYNALSSCLDLLIHRDDIELISIYTGEESEHTDQIILLAESNNITYQTNKPSAIEMEKLVSQGAECFICAEYPYKISLPKTILYGVNIHPTSLPEGRGQTPLPHLILTYPQHAGITLHKLSDQFDEGDILLSESLDISKDETFDSLHAKIFLRAPILLQQLFDDWDSLFKAAKKQNNGSIWPSIKHEQQSIDWAMEHQQIDKISRAFASLGVKFTLNQTDYYYTSAQCVEFEHAYEAGDVISFDDFKLIIAIMDGFIIIPRPCLFEL